MSKVKPTLPSGTRDFGPNELCQRNYIFGVIKNVFEKYGFQPLETPAMENISTLEGKYGEAGDKLIYKIRSNKNLLEHYPELKNSESLRKVYPYDWIPMASDKALRYDLTIPFARYVVQHQSEITFPFKRYQIQPVWRADRTQRGRYKEFYQCDIDVIGSNSLLNEVELILVYDEVFRRLGLDVTIKINNRKILTAICEITEIPLVKFNEVIGAIDEFDRVGRVPSMDNLSTKGFSLLQIQRLKDIVFPLMDIHTKSIHGLLQDLFTHNKSSSGITGLQEIQYIHEAIKKIYGKNLVEIASIQPVAPRTTLYPSYEPQAHKLKLHFDVALARGLDYYTGTILEVKANNVQMGSIGGGGRYDNLTGVFGLPGVSGVGISFGVERIYDVMEELKLFDNIDLQSNTTRALFINFGGEAETKSFQYLQQLRAKDIPAEIYPSNEKMKKQIGYADKKEIPYAIFVGEEELKSGLLQVKDLKSGEQKLYKIDEVIELLSRK